MKARSFAPTLALLSAVFMATTSPTKAEDAPRPLGVVELFTSQGCNSCPPADSVLGRLAESGQIVALGYHVDYWDYLGWKDTLADPANTERQYAYGQSFGIRSVYTPQAVINGRLHVNGANRDAITRALGDLDRSGQGMQVGLSVSRVDGSVVIETGADAKADGDAQLMLVHFEPVRAIEIQRGENKGKLIRYINPVTSVQTAGMWHGGKARFEMPESEISRTAGCAALLQTVSKTGLPGRIIGAVILRKPGD